MCFDIYSRGNKRSLRIHNDLLNKISEEDYLNNRFPFKLEWLGKNSKIKQPSYYPTHKSGLGNQNNPLPLKYLLFNVTGSLPSMLLLPQSAFAAAFTDILPYP